VTWWLFLVLVGGAVLLYAWFFERPPRPVLPEEAGGILHSGVPLFPWIEKRVLHREHDVLTVGFYHRALRAGVTLDMHLDDCYSTAWVQEPLFGGPPGWVRYLDDSKVAAKMELVFGTELRRMGWLEEPEPGWGPR
jgi:hypothetical protein